MTKSITELVEAAHRDQAVWEQAEAGCPHAPVSYDEKYDAYYCAECDIWLEPFCEDPDCDFCTRVPLRPSER